MTEREHHENATLIYANFDPDEWGPCDDIEHGMPFFQFMSRCALAAGAIAAAGTFFYYLEEMKQQQRIKQRQAKSKLTDSAKSIDENEEEGVVHRIVRIANQLYNSWQKQHSQHRLEGESVLSQADSFLSEATEYHSVRSSSPTIPSPTPSSSPSTTRKTNISITTMQHTKTYVREVTTSSGEYPNHQPILLNNDVKVNDNLTASIENHSQHNVQMHYEKREDNQLADGGSTPYKIDLLQKECKELSQQNHMPLTQPTLVNNSNDHSENRLQKQIVTDEEYHQQEGYAIENVAQGRVKENEANLSRLPEQQIEAHQVKSKLEPKKELVEKEDIQKQKQAKVLLQELNAEMQKAGEQIDAQEKRVDNKGKYAEYLSQLEAEKQEQIEQLVKMEEQSLAERLKKHMSEDVGEQHAPTPPPTRRESMHESGASMEHPSSGVIPQSPLLEEEAWEALKRDGADANNHATTYDQYVMLEAQRRFSLKPRAPILDQAHDPHLVIVDAQPLQKAQFDFFVEDMDDEQAVVEKADESDYANDPHFKAASINDFQYEFMQETFHESPSSKQFDVQHDESKNDPHEAALQANSTAYKYDFILGDEEDAQASTAMQPPSKDMTSINKFADNFTQQLIKEASTAMQPPSKDMTSINKFADNFTQQLIEEVSDEFRYNSTIGNGAQPLVFGHVGQKTPQGSKPKLQLYQGSKDHEIAIDTIEKQHIFLPYNTSNVDAKILTEDEQKVHSPPLAPARKHKSKQQQPQQQLMPVIPNDGASNYDDFNEAPFEQQYATNEEAVLIKQVTRNQLVAKLAAQDRSVTDEPSATDAGDIESIEMDDDKGLRSADRQFLAEATHQVDVMTANLNEQQLKQLLQLDANDIESSIKKVQQQTKLNEPFTSFQGQPSAPQMFASDGSPINIRRQQEQKRATKTSQRNHTEQQSRKLLKAQRSDSIMEATGTNDIQELLKKYKTLESWSKVMRDAGLKTCNMIFGIDYTASNKYQGEQSFNNRSLHSISQDTANPYQQVIRIMGRTLGPMSTSGVIPVYGFGDLYTSDWSVFALKTDDYCQSFEEVLSVYNEVTPNVILSGPTNFAPLIYQAIEICQKMGNYHILVIVADGQVTNERATRRAIVDACAYPLSIIVVGVGDGPWQMMRAFDDSLPKRPWDNFHFVEFHELIKQAGMANTEVAFAVNALLEIPDQYKMIKKLGLL